MESHKKSVAGLVDFYMLLGGESKKASKDSNARTVVFYLPIMPLKQEFRTVLSGLKNGS
ncbi:MAG TPA: hypothetical protein VNS32_17375 [Flavisolibacter sp.]|nr:hypothetical protein [Flavisolibacter sp.]